MKKSELPDTLEVLKGIYTLIIEVRTPNRDCERGREEGVHCKAVLHPHLKHICDTETSIQCAHMSELHTILTPLLLERDATIYVETVASHLSFDRGTTQVSAGSEELLLERWVIKLEHAGVQQRGGGRKLLLQAIHSHLHFSQLSAWLSSSRGHFPANITYRIKYDKKLEFKAPPDQHRFPIVGVGENKCMVVMVDSLPRSTLHLPDNKPDLPRVPKLDYGETLASPSDCEMKSKMKSPTVKSPSSCSQQVKQRMYSERGSECVPLNGGGDICVLSAAETFRKYDPLHDSGIYSPNSSYRSSKSSSRGLPSYRSPSPTFYLGDESSLDSDIYPPSRDACSSSDFTPLSISPTPYNSPQHSLTESNAPLRSTPYPWALSDMFTLSSPPKITYKPPELALKPRVLASSPTPSSSRNSPEPLETLKFSPIKFDSPMKFKLLKNSQRRSSSLCIEEEGEFEEQSPFMPCSSTDDMISSWHGNPYLDKPSFKRSTSLPLLSSPVLYRKACCRGDRKILGQTVVNSNKNCLLGTFEENIIKDRFTPCGSISGFKFKMSVSGIFSSPPITLPFTGNFYSFSEQYCPSPYTGCIKLDTCGTHGYQISKQGRIQATIFDPANSVIRILLVPYDVRDMPARSQTFIRQRIHAVSTNGSKTLQYHVHFRILTGRSTRVYLHTEIRVLFVRGTSSIDATDSEPGGSSVTMVTENCIPSDPRYSTMGKTKRSS